MKVKRQAWAKFPTLFNSLLDDMIDPNLKVIKQSQYNFR